MELKARFDVVYMEAALLFLESLPEKVRDKNTGNLVITTHGFIKKTQKTPEKEIDRAEALRKEYYSM